MVMLVVNRAVIVHCRGVHCIVVVGHHWCCCAAGAGAGWCCQIGRAHV